ncbi:hypothetical protein L1987_35549 [Smallanthus sonchifolius]|uniref:Uncharacterized protein n=1 Tax=Smallanthus sonchifolius TaxID=185202 RepID=A0ACB9HY32_9ASTR|nr:hypothetical protein L1987_35549 [Smallanthus sonchifolius]
MASSAISCCSPLLWNAISLNHRRRPPPLSSWAKPVVVRAQVNSGSGRSKPESSEQKWVAKGLITESLPNGMFWVRLENGDVVLGYISGKIRRNSIRMLAGDKVKIEVSRYDSTRGRIVYRIGNKDS